MKKSLAHYLGAGALAASAVFAASPAMADTVACGSYRPGMLAFVTGIRPATCAYQGDYMVQQGPTYSGPAVIAPQPTYSPSPTVAAYVHGPYQAPAAVQAEPVRERAVRRTTRVKRTAVKMPPGKGKVQIVRARAEVRIYGPERMEIRLYRR